MTHYKVIMEVNANVAIPRNAINTNKCCLCHNILSVPPIMIVSSEEDHYICGRCKDIKYTTFTRNTMFENIARFMLLPCTYEKCTAIIPWDLIELHEQNCPYRTVRCPIFYQGCKDVVEIANLQLHFREKHILNLKTGRESWPLNIKYHYVHLWIVENLRFFVYILHFDNLYSTSVLSVDPIRKYKKYNVKLTAMNGEHCFIVYKNQSIFHYNERQHCYKCVRGQCKTKYHPFSQENKMSAMNLTKFTNEMNKILITTISGSGGDIKYTIYLIEEPEEESKEESKMAAIKIK